MHYLHIKFPANSSFDTPLNALAVLVEDLQNTSQFTETTCKEHVQLIAFNLILTVLSK